MWPFSALHHLVACGMRLLSLRTMCLRLCVTAECRRGHDDIASKSFTKVLKSFNLLWPTVLSVAFFGITPSCSVRYATVVLEDDVSAAMCYC